MHQFIIMPYRLSNIPKNMKYHAWERVSGGGLERPLMYLHQYQVGKYISISATSEATITSLSYVKRLLDSVGDSLF